ncbi:MAG: VWA domain-containing protein [Burkholderiales bacterium]|nr:VWA domain-containing protein [Burkholderiales bacterium]
MEELVGKLWHQFITRAASSDHEEAIVHLSEMRRAIEILFRAAGGDATVRLREAAAQQHGGARSWLQRIAGSATHDALPMVDPESLALPPSIAVFDEAPLNRDLYLWLATLAACHVDTGRWIDDNLWATHCALQVFPGLRPRYERLLARHLNQRPPLQKLKGRAAQAESMVQQALQSAQPSALHSVATPPMRQDIRIRADEVSPVWLWLSPIANPAAEVARRSPPAGEDHRPPGEVQQDRKRRRAHHTENASDRNGMMMFFRAESVLSWSEYVKVNRQTDDDDDGNAIQAADDMNTLAIAPDGQTSAARVKFDLDLPGAAQDDLPLGPGVRLPEWHWKSRTLVPEHCSAQLLEARDPEPYTPPDYLRRTANRIRRKLEVLRSLPRHLHAQTQGEELDLDAWVQWRTEAITSPRHVGEAPVYSRRQSIDRSLSCLLLADLSLSTDAWANNEQRVIDVIRESLYVFGEALTALGDPFAMLGFSSVRRQNVRMHLLKRFNEPWNAQIQARVGAIRPGYYTRMGAAIRYAIKGLEARPERQRLLLLLTDGKPNDLDVYEGRHGLEDTRQAVLEAKAAGLVPYCVTIDHEAHDYLPSLFGQKGFAVVHNPADLVSRLSTAYAQLATPKG